MYNDPNFLKMGLHRKINVFDPSYSDNPLVTQAIYDSSLKRNTKKVINKLINHELERYESTTFITLPTSYALIHHRINNAWIDLIHQMVFEDKMYNAFSMEFKDIIESIILSDDVNNIDYTVYRYKDGETIFHMAARTWLISEYGELLNSSLTYSQKNQKNMDNLTYILLCYREIGKCIGDELSILGIEDSGGIPLDHSLKEFVDVLSST
jgi:hypothetical protein